MQEVKRFALVNGRVVTPQTVENGKAIIVEGSTIAGIVPAGELDDEITKIDVDGRLITPGLIDIHTHGATGHTFNEPTAEAFGVITRENARRGVTSLLATPATAPIANLVACLEFSREWMAGERDGAQVLGVHLEGPYFRSGPGRGAGPGQCAQSR